MAFFKNLKTKIYIVEYFPKIPLEMNSTHPFSPILIPDTPYVPKFSDLFFIGASAIKTWEKSRIFKYGLPEGVQKLVAWVIIFFYLYSFYLYPFCPKCHLHLFVYLSICLFICFSVFLFFCLSFCLFVFLSFCLFAILSVCLLVYLPVCSFVCYSIFLLFCLSLFTYSYPFFLMSSILREIYP